MHCSFICHWRLHHHQPYYFKLFYDRPSAAKIKVKIYFLREKKNEGKEMKSHSLLKHHSRTNKKFKRKLILNLSEFRVLTQNGLYQKQAQRLSSSNLSAMDRAATHSLIHPGLEDPPGQGICNFSGPHPNCSSASPLSKNLF